MAAETEIFKLSVKPTMGFLKRRQTETTPHQKVHRSLSKEKTRFLLISKSLSHNPQRVVRWQQFDSPIALMSQTFLHRVMPVNIHPLLPPIAISRSIFLVLISSTIWTSCTPNTSQLRITALVCVTGKHLL